MRVIAATTMATLLAGLSIPAYAGDTKFFPATMCQGSAFIEENRQLNIGGAVGFVLDTYFANPSPSTTGAAYNNVQNQDMSMVCPIVRDVVRADGLGWSSLIVNALNLSHTRTLTCNAQTFYKNDYTFGSISSNSLGPLTDWTDLSLSALALPVDGYIIISCVVPRMDANFFPSGLASYRIDE